MINPYHTGYADTQDLATAPFAGRKEAFARLYARLFDPVNTGALLFIGQQHIGKTALLYNADSVFRERRSGLRAAARHDARQRRRMAALRGAGGYQRADRARLHAGTPVAA